MGWGRDGRDPPSRKEGCGVNKNVGVGWVGVRVVSVQQIFKEMTLSLGNVIIVSGSFNTRNQHFHFFSNSSFVLS